MGKSSVLGMKYGMTVYCESTGFIVLLKKLQGNITREYNNENGDLVRC